MNNGFFKKFKKFKKSNDIHIIFILFFIIFISFGISKTRFLTNGSESNYNIYPESASLEPVYDELFRNGIKVQEKEKVGEQLFLLLSVKKEEAKKTFTQEW